MIVGIDIARTCDHTAIVVLDGWTVRLVEQLPIGLEYKEIVEQLKQYIDRADRVFVDATGIGDPILEQLKDHAIDKIVGIKITGGNTARTGGRQWSVPKKILAQALVQAFGREALTIEAPEPGRSILRRELLAFNYRPGIVPKFEARPGAHDDCVLALALAVFGKLAS
jgi:hypothetical protein